MIIGAHPSTHRMTFLLLDGSVLPGVTVVMGKFDNTTFSNVSITGARFGMLVIPQFFNSRFTILERASMALSDI